MALEDYLVPTGAFTNICFDCQNACGGCSWSKSFTPVPGWSAKAVKLYVGTNGHKPHIIDTYHITACPEFVRDEERPDSASAEWTLDQLNLAIARGRY